MRNFTNCCAILPALLLCYLSAMAQNPDDTEFRKGSVTYLKLTNGVITNFHSSPDMYAGGILLNHQVTIIQHKLRAGANAGFVYANKEFSGLLGPSVSFKLSSINLKNLAGLANLHLVGEHLWGTDKQRLAGGGIGLELLQKILFQLTAHRDYRLNNWWIQTHLGIRLGKKKAVVPEFSR
jgi:hypothetical protein